MLIYLYYALYVTFTMYSDFNIYSAQYNNFIIGSAVIPTALATALDINLSNISLVFITVTFATMV